MLKPSFKKKYKRLLTSSSDSDENYNNVRENNLLIPDFKKLMTCTDIKENFNNNNSILGSDHLSGSENLQNVCVTSKHKYSLQSSDFDNESTRVHNGLLSSNDDVSSYHPKEIKKHEYSQISTTSDNEDSINNLDFCPVGKLNTNIMLKQMIAAGLAVVEKIKSKNRDQNDNIYMNDKSEHLSNESYNNIDEVVNRTSDLDVVLANKMTHNEDLKSNPFLSDIEIKLNKNNKCALTKVNKNQNTNIGIHKLKKLMSRKLNINKLYSEEGIEKDVLLSKETKMKQKTKKESDLAHEEEEVLQKKLAELGKRKAKEELLRMRKEQKKEEILKRTFFEKFIKSDWNEFWILKFFLSFPIGLIFAFVIYKITFENLSLPLEIQYYFALFFITFFALGFATSVAIRCISCLIIPISVGECGRIYLYAFIISLIITGPVSNTLNNCNEVIRGLICGFNMIVNRTKTSIGIRVVPIIDVMIDIQKSHMELVDKIRDFLINYTPIKSEILVNKTLLDEIKDQVEADDIDLQRTSQRLVMEKKYRLTGEVSRLKKIQRDYQEKVECRCQGIISDGIRGCKQCFYDAETRCHDKLPVIGLLLCLPMKMTFLCNVIFKFMGWIGITCDALKIIKPSFSDDFNIAEEATNEMMKQFEANMQYMTEEKDEEDVMESLNLVTPDEVELVITQSYKYREKIIKFWLEIIRRLMPFLFLIVIYSAQTYHQRYCIDIQFDNAYVTQYFEYIDKRRYLLGKRILLPLKKLEKTEINKISSWAYNREETKNLMISTIWIISIAFALLILLMIDHALSTILAFITKHSKIDYVQEGKHHIALTISGTGILAKVIRALLVGFNRTHEVNITSTNLICLPHPSFTNVETSVNIYVLLVTIWIFHLMEAHVRRIQHIVPAFFYRKRQKKRILHLYNDMLRRRIGFLHQARHRVRRRIKTNTFDMSVGFFLALRYKYMPYFEWLKILHLGLQKCLICNEKETKNFIHCPTLKCRATYCAECWKDVNHRCYACKDDDDWSISSGGNAALDGLDMQKKLTY